MAWIRIELGRTSVFFGLILIGPDTKIIEVNVFLSIDSSELRIRLLMFAKCIELIALVHQLLHISKQQGEFRQGQ